jgi:hypothetical protein
LFSHHENKLSSCYCFSLIFIVFVSSLPINLRVSSANFKTESSKINRHHLTGNCLVCRDITDYCLIFEFGGASKVERYCNECLEKEKVTSEEMATNDYE